MPSPSAALLPTPREARISFSPTAHRVPSSVDGPLNAVWVIQHVARVIWRSPNGNGNPRAA